MSTSNEPPANPPPGSMRRTSGTVLILSLALAVSTTAAIVFAVLYLQQREPLIQHDTVSPQGKYGGTVIYPIPYRSLPNLKLSSAKRPIDIPKQDEMGFTWEAKALVEDIKDDKGFGAEMLARRYPLWYLAAEGYLGQTAPQIEDFSWEARGVRGTAN